MSTSIPPQITDLYERETSLDPTRSFIVQAPAGSGKTSLLVQRYLVLLTRAETPEEIIAITFTRKAAAEMHERVLNALLNANQPSDSNDSYLLKTKLLAQMVLKCDAEHNWHLLDSPQRLNIQTIDAFCQKIARQAPLSAGCTANAKILQNAAVETCYLEATRTILEQILRQNNQDDPQLKHLKNLLLHLDNDVARLEDLCVAMLKRRDQWLPHLTPIHDDNILRQTIESALKTIAEENLKEFLALFPQELCNEFNQLAAFANSNLEYQIKKTEYLSIQIPHSFALLLTKEYAWRKVVNKTMGFPPAAETTCVNEKGLRKNMKERMDALLKILQPNENLRKKLEYLLKSPPTQYTDQQWQNVCALASLLKLLAAQLHVTFSKQGATDYVEIAIAAQNALGNSDEPTEIALNLDYRIQHLLIDEFQDTSVAQFCLLEKLITGWQPDDGRTLFLVGDPMQSIYRFREAEVGLFLRAQREGINSVPLESLVLTTNFRSLPNVVNWVNTIFPKIFPEEVDIANGAVPFTPAVCSLENSQNKSGLAEVKIFATDDETQTAFSVVEKIQSIQKENPEHTIAILVRARQHLQHILPALRRTKINYQAIELETLSESMVVQDLFALTRALLSLADRIAWLAILRAPWCGLSLSDLYVIANGPHATILENIYDSNKICKENYHINQFTILNSSKNKVLTLSTDGAGRLARILPIITESLQNRARQPWRIWLENTWLALGGPACLSKDELEQQHAESYFTLLDQQDQLDLQILAKELERLYVKPGSQTPKNSVQIMTIHKAKGLEFDHVIIPAIEKTGRQDETKLLLWQERTCTHGDQSDLILAPIKATDAESDPIYQYLNFCEREKSFYELGRLLYVATTRAKKTLSLFGQVSDKKVEKIQETKEKKVNNLLGLLAPCWQDRWLQHTVIMGTPHPAQLILNTNSRENKYRISIGQENLFPTKSNSKKTPVETVKIFKNTVLSEQKTGSILELGGIGGPQKYLGQLIHTILAKLSQKNLPNNTNEYIQQQQDTWRLALLQLGVNPSELESSLQIVNQALKNILNDPRGRWILDFNHQDAKSEYALTSVNNSGIAQHLVIDRTFIDENGIRWVIDYKTTANEDNVCERYRKQLENYANILSSLDPRPIRLGVYLTNCSGWEELENEGIKE